jgi:hypothetical protein
MRNVLDKSVKENQNTFFVQSTFCEIFADYEILWEKNTKCTVMFKLQPWLEERAKCYVGRTLTVFSFNGTSMSTVKWAKLTSVFPCLCHSTIAPYSYVFRLPPTLYDISN